MTLTKNPTESQQAYVDRISKAYKDALDNRHNYEASELYKQLIIEREKLKVK